MSGCIVSEFNAGDIICVVLSEHLVVLFAVIQIADSVEYSFVRLHSDGSCAYRFISCVVIEQNRHFSLHGISDTRIIDTRRTLVRNVPVEQLGKELVIDVLRRCSVYLKVKITYRHCAVCHGVSVCVVRISGFVRLFIDNRNNVIIVFDTVLEREIKVKTCNPVVER